MPQLHKILIGLVLMSAIVTGFILFIAGGVVYYTPSDYNGSQLRAFNETAADISEISNQTAQQLQALQGNPSLADIIGAFFGSAYSAVLTVGNSVGTFFTVINVGVEALPLGGYSNTLINVLATIVIIIIFIGIIMHVVTKSDRT